MLPAPCPGRDLEGTLHPHATPALLTPAQETHQTPHPWTAQVLHDNNRNAAASEKCQKWEIRTSEVLGTAVPFQVVLSFPLVHSSVLEGLRIAISLE